MYLHTYLCMSPPGVWAGWVEQVGGQIGGLADRGEPLPTWAPRSLI